ncbi:MAG: hypothetical protein KDA85_19045, partial [Planctomycetaceae bacterium]|nr:hypothetical protein [Planctomycetaceae bacterium]
EHLCSVTCDGKHGLLMADVGENLRQGGNEQPGCRLYLVEEPVLPATETAEAGETVVTVRPHSVIALSWPNGPHDCEAVAVDPERREILLVTKGLLNDCSLYSGPLSLQAGTQSVTAKHLQRMLLPLVTGMDISSDSRQLAITTMMNAVVVTRESTDDWSTAAGRSPRTLTTPPRRQGETICFTADGSGLLLNSEFENQPLWYLPLTDNEPVR